jgi:hypothetical protein
MKGKVEQFDVYSVEVNFCKRAGSKDKADIGGEAKGIV